MDANALALSVTRMNRALMVLPESPEESITYFAQAQTTAEAVDETVAYYTEHGYQSWSWPGDDGHPWLCVRAEHGKPLPPVPTAA